MQPLKMLAFSIGAMPIAAFLLTLLLTEGAPLYPPAPGEESGPAVATQTLPRAKQERQDGVATVGHSYATAGSVAPPPIVNAAPDAQPLLSLFGAAPPDVRRDR